MTEVIIDIPVAEDFDVDEVNAYLQWMSQEYYYEQPILEDDDASGR